MTHWVHRQVVSDTVLPATAVLTTTPASESLHPVVDLSQGHLVVGRVEKALEQKLGPDTTELSALVWCDDGLDSIRGAGVLFVAHSRRRRTTVTC